MGEMFGRIGEGMNFKPDNDLQKRLEETSGFNPCASVTRLNFQRCIEFLALSTGEILVQNFYPFHEVCCNLGKYLIYLQVSFNMRQNYAIHTIQVLTTIVEKGKTKEARYFTSNVG